MKITILGCGAFGSALKTPFLEKKLDLWMWSKFEKEIQNHPQEKPSIHYTTSLKEAIQNTNLIIIAIPINFLKDTLTELKKDDQKQNILIASKGIDTKTLKFAYQIVEETLGEVPLGVLSGGSFAIDMSNKNVLGLTLATTNQEIQQIIKEYMENEQIKMQYTKDILGVSICGAIKNVMAIGYGILDGANLPDSSKFLYLTNAIYEIKYLIHKLNGDQETIMTYAGIDDIMMTCTSHTSRNYTLGSLIGQNAPKEKIEEYKKNTTIEGLGTTKAIQKIAEKQKINLPLTNTIYQILYQNKKATELINILKKENFTQQ